MPYTPPAYESGSVVYMRESAVLGFLEPHTINSVYMGQDGWVYTVLAKSTTMSSVGSFGERRSMVNGALLQFNECEFVNLCQALLLAKSYHERQLNAINSKLQSHCDDYTGTS